MVFWGLAEARQALAEAREFDWGTVTRANVYEVMGRFAPPEVVVEPRGVSIYQMEAIFDMREVPWGEYVRNPGHPYNTHHFEALGFEGTGYWVARNYTDPGKRRTLLTVEDMATSAYSWPILVYPKPEVPGEEFAAQVTDFSATRAPSLGEAVKTYVKQWLESFIIRYSERLKREFNQDRANRETPDHLMGRRERAEKRAKVTMLEGQDVRKLEQAIERSRRAKGIGQGAISAVDIEGIETERASRRWGIEIELAGARGVGIPEGWDLKEDCSLRSAYIDWDDDECGCAANNYECYYCDEGEHYECEECQAERHGDTGEYVSPPMTEAYAEGIVEICDDARYEPQNESAGIHVHVEATDLTPRQVGALVFAYSVIEPIIAEDYEREEWQYCLPLEPRRAARQMSQIREVRSVYAGETSDLIRSRFYGERYQTVNVNALSAHGTIEFRGMGPVYQAKHLHKWARFCREMVNCAKNNAPGGLFQAAETMHDVLAIFEKYGEETKVKAERYVSVA